MREVYVLRHGEKDDQGVLTARGEEAARAMRGILPQFARVIASDSDRTILTAKLLIGRDPLVDKQASYAPAPTAVSETIRNLAKNRGISFLDAARQHNDPEVLRGIDEQAHKLNNLIDELLGALAEDERALIVSHDLTIAPAMGFRGMSAESIAPLTGYIVSMINGQSSVRRIN